MQKKLNLFVLNLIVLLTLGFGRIYGQVINLTIDEARKVNETFAKLDLSNAQNRLLQIDLKAYQDSTTIYKDSTTYWKNKAVKLKHRRNNWRLIALLEATYIALTSRKK